MTRRRVGSTARETDVDLNPRRKQTMAEATITEVGQNAGSSTGAIAAPPRNTEAGTKDKKGKKERVKKVPMRGDDDPKFTEWPATFDKAQHKPLRRSDFADERIWLRKQVDSTAQRLDRLKKELDDFDKYGDPKVRKQAQKTEAMALQALEMMKELQKNGVDVSEMRATFESLFSPPTEG
jgi:hypothetical protein